jgi:hypothetical protein
MGQHMRTMLTPAKATPRIERVSVVYGDCQECLGTRRTVPTVLKIRWYKWPITLCDVCYETTRTLISATAAKDVGV